MSYEIHTQQAETQTIASVRGRANHRNIGEVIGMLLTPMWDFIRANNIAHRGLNVAI